MTSLNFLLSLPFYLRVLLAVILSLFIACAMMISIALCDGKED